VFAKEERMKMAGVRMRMEDEIQNDAEAEEDQTRIL
jgi:hypothetical protein